jgi:LacI family transcriptional regulator
MRSKSAQRSPSKPTTIYEVAQRAGVSIATVSRVVNELDGVGDQTRQYVQQIIKDMKYVPDHGARQLARGRR